MEKLRRYRFILGKYRGLLAVWFLCAGSLPALTTVIMSNPTPFVGNAYVVFICVEAVLRLLIYLSIVVTVFLFPVGMRQKGKYLLVAAAIFAAISIGDYWSGQIRLAAYEKIEGPGQQIVAAIERYERVHHGPPANLGQLVPDYITTIPEPGIPGFSSFVYLPKRTCEHVNWTLSISRNVGYAIYDKLLYCPQHCTPWCKNGNLPSHTEHWSCWHT